MPLTDNSHGHLRQSIIPAHGAFPLYRAGQAHTTHFYDRADLEIGIPLASTAAKLIFFSRRQVTPIGIPIHLPLTRQHAIQLGFGDQIGPTQEDVHELNQHKVVKHVPRDSDFDTPTPSSQLDDDWYRLTDCIYPMEKSSLKNTHYTYGSATGLWQGRILVPTENAFASILQHVQMPEEFTEQQLSLNAYPLFMRLREYHCVDPQDPVPTGGADDGFDDCISNAWIPKGVQVHEDAVSRFRLILVLILIIDNSTKVNSGSNTTTAHTHTRLIAQAQQTLMMKLRAADASTVERAISFIGSMMISSWRSGPLRVTRAMQILMWVKTMVNSYKMPRVTIQSSTMFSVRKITKTWTKIRPLILRLHQTTRVMRENIALRGNATACLISHLSGR
jgi:hypothetical protein